MFSTRFSPITANPIKPMSHFSAIVEPIVLGDSLGWTCPLRSFNHRRAWPEGWAFDRSSASRVENRIYCHCGPTMTCPVRVPGTQPMAARERGQAPRASPISGQRGQARRAPSRPISKGGQARQAARASPIWQRGQASRPEPVPICPVGGRKPAGRTYRASPQAVRTFVEPPETDSRPRGERLGGLGSQPVARP